MWPNWIEKAAQVTDSGEYYQANQSLKSVEEGFRFDVTDVDAVPNKAANKMSKAETTSASTKKWWDGLYGRRLLVLEPAPHHRDSDSMRAVGTESDGPQRF